MAEIVYSDYCPRDYKHHHDWHSLGAAERHGFMCEIFRCSQCRMARLETLEFVNPNKKPGRRREQ